MSGLSNLKNGDFSAHIYKIIKNKNTYFFLLVSNYQFILYIYFLVVP